MKNKLLSSHCTVYVIGVGWSQCWPKVSCLEVGEKSMSMWVHICEYIYGHHGGI